MLDTVLGVGLFFLMATMPDMLIRVAHVIGKPLHHASIEEKVNWLLGHPAGFKPNKQMAYFIGHVIKYLIEQWENMSDYLNASKPLIIIYLSVVGSLGASLQAAALHDLLFLCQVWILGLYSFIAGSYWYTISLLSTLQGLFRGRKFNTIRMRTDSTSFGVAEMYLGVMIVSIILFLLPTLAMFYYYVFMSIILFVMAIQLLLVFL